ncbi:hypothetical protein ACH4YO_02740 [Streptomyces noursei]|uniref:hypothetical protein n=1 Tax=Streptomyces noursei TaxID=1971 RepID=UPI0033C3F230
MQQSKEWRTLWQEFDENDARRLISDACGGIRLVTDEGMHDPEKVIALGIAGAEAAEGIVAGLDSEWALYTPKQAAALASALFAQVHAVGAALEKLGAFLYVMAARGDVEMPRFRAESDEPPNLSDAEIGIGRAAEEIHGVVSRADSALVLADVPYLGKLPTDAHQTITAVAGLLGDTAKLIDDHHVQDAAELADQYHEGFGCGCRVELTDTAGAVWEFARGDSEWCLVRLDGISDDGYIRDDAWIQLANSQATAHPAHLVLLIRRALTAPSAAAAS